MATEDSLLPDPGIPSPFPSEGEMQRSQRKALDEGGMLDHRPHRAAYIAYPRLATRMASFGRRLSTSIELTNCGHNAVVELPYETPRGDVEKARVCLICDCGFLSPRLTT